MTARYDGDQATAGPTVVDRPFRRLPEHADDRTIGRLEMPVEARDARELCDLEARLIARFCPPLRPEVVRRCLCDVIAHFDGARVRTYVAVLIERRATEALRANAADAGRASTHEHVTEVKPRQPAVRQLVASDENR